MNKAVKVAVQLQSVRLRDEAQKENDEFLKTIDENMQKIINEQTSYAVAADLSEMELKKILIEKMEGNKSIHRSNEQRNLYKALVKAYESDKIMLDTYRDTITLKRCPDDDRNLYKALVKAYESDKIMLDTYRDTITLKRCPDDRRREGKEPDSASAPKEKATRSADKSTQGSKSRQTLESESTTAEEPMQTTFEMEEPSHPEFETGADDQPIVEPSQHPKWFSQQKKPPTPYRRRVIPFDHFINNDLEYLRGGASSRKYTTSVTKTEAADYEHIKIIVVTKLKIVEWHNYKHLDWITVRRDDDKLYKFKEGDFKRLRIQDIEDIIVIQRRVKDLQLGVESYQKKLNLTKPDTYHSDLKRKEAYIACLNPRGFIYQNKDKLNRLMWINELHKFSDGTLTDVRTALDDHLKDHEELGEVCWRKAVRGRLQDALKDHMIYDMLSLSFKRSKSKNMGIVPIEMELILHHTKQGTSYEVS
nr:hypothetical protein [Tanacetum cinerariifolium]